MLKEKLQKMMEASRAKLPAAAKPVVTAATQAVADSIRGRSIPVIGDAMPEFNLTDSKGTEHTSKSLIGDGQLIITFFRGSW